MCAQPANNSTQLEGVRAGGHLGMWARHAVHVHVHAVHMPMQQYAPAGTWACGQDMQSTDPSVLWAYT